MAKFNNTKMDRQIESFVRQSNETTKIPYIQMIADENLVDYTNNNEDTNDTTDIENAIREIGFTDPIEVTNLNNGKYMILSGHRRRVAGVKTGLKEFPCLVLPLKKEDDIHNYVLLANSHRDSSKDPLLYCKRYKMHEAYLDKIGFEGIKRDEIAKRLGISTVQADRYKRFNEIIAPVWELVRTDKVGMSSVLSMSTLSIVDQEAIYDIFAEILKDEDRINREKCELIIKRYSTRKNADEILKMFKNDQTVTQDTTQKNDTADNKPSIGKRIEDEAAVAKIDEIKYQVNVENDMNGGKSGLTFNGDEIGDDLPYFYKNYEDSTKNKTDDLSDAGITEYNEDDQKNFEANDRINDMLENRMTDNNVKSSDDIELGVKLEKYLLKLNKILSKDYKLSDNNTANETIQTMIEIIAALVSQINNIMKTYDIPERPNNLKNYVNSIISEIWDSRQPGRRGKPS